MRKRKSKAEARAFDEMIEARYKKRREANNQVPIRIKPKTKPKPDPSRRIIKRERKRVLDKRGYPLTKDGKLEHREIYKNTYGPIPKDWVVHHIDQCKVNNDPDNLIALPQPLHHLLHKTMWQLGESWKKKKQFKFLRKRFKRLGLVSTRSLDS